MHGQQDIKSWTEVVKGKGKWQAVAGAQSEFFLESRGGGLTLFDTKKYVTNTMS